MTRGKALQEGVRVKLPPGMTWEKLVATSPDEIREKDLFPQGFLPAASEPRRRGMVFPTFHIDEIQKQEGRDLTRFDLDFDLPDHFLPEFPAPMFLTTRPDLGDVSQGKLVTIENFFELFNGILNPKQLEGLRLWRRRSPSSSSTKRTTAGRNGRVGGVLNVTRMATRMPPPIWSATSGPRRSATASIPRPCGGCRSNGCSARNGRCAVSKTSPSSSSGPPTSMGIP